jgi:uncharacterized membrane protein
MRGYGYWNPGVGHGAFTWSLFLILLAWGAIFLIVFIVFHHRSEHYHSLRYVNGLMHEHKSPALRILEERLARGELTPEGFRAARDALPEDP